MENVQKSRGELVLLGVFALFILGFLWDIRELPIEGKLLSYIAAPIALVLMGYCAFRALVPAKTSEEEDDGEGAEPNETKVKSKRRMYLTIGFMFGVFASVCLIGFYFGIGLMLLLWFAALRRVKVSTVAIAFVMPALLYAILELFLEVGLPKGMVFTWLGG